MAVPRGTRFEVELPGGAAIVGPVSADMALPFANRLEVPLRHAFPSALIVDWDVLDPLVQELVSGRDTLHAASEAETEGGGRA